MEIWKDIIGFENYYQVSNQGRVKSLKRKGRLKEKILKQFDLKKYSAVILSKNSLSKTKTIHRLVASAFIPNPKNKEQVNHINGIKSDNRVENLEWATASENTQHAFDSGLNDAVRFSSSKTGFKNGIKARALTFDIANEIRSRYKTENISSRQLAKEYKVGQSTILGIVNNKTYLK